MKNSWMFKYFMVFALVTTMYLPGELHAQDTRGNGDPSSEEAALDLLKVFDEATEIATKSKLNADYVPGMVTVLHGKDLQARGVGTVLEALALVPGFDITINGSFKQVTVRGVGSTLASGNIKLLWNSIPMNTNIAGLNLQLLEYPVAQVERIEVIRGPGSAVHGEYALTGVVNVITRKQGSQVYGRGGSFETYGGGLLYSWADPGEQVDISFNVAGVTSDGPDVVTGPDVLGVAPFSNAPGPANEDNDNLSSGLHLRYKKFYLDAQILHSGWGDMFGPANALPQPIDKITYRLTTYALQGRQELDLGRSLQMNLKLGWWQDRIKWGDDSLVFPPGFPGFPNGMVSAPASKEIRLFGGTDLTWKGWVDHTLLLGWSFSWSKIQDSSFAANFVPSTGAPVGSTQTWRGSESWIQAGNDRLLNSVFVQDEYNLNTDLTLTLGLRYDHYDDVGDRLTPRVAGVYRLTDHQILKAQYAQAFRPPTFVEMFGQNNPVTNGNPSTNPSVIDTFEVGYIYKQSGTVFRTTFFYSELDDLIVNQGGVYSNSGGADQMGMELEWEQEITSQLKWNSNLTLIESQNRETNESVEGSANLLANVGVNYRPMNDLMFNVQYRYVGHRHRAAGDTREDLAGYNNVDFTANWFKPFGGQGWTLRGGVRNLFDEDIYYAAPANTYPADYPRPGISFWAQLSYEF